MVKMVFSIRFTLVPIDILVVLSGFATLPGKPVSASSAWATAFDLSAALATYNTEHRTDSSDFLASHATPSYLMASMHSQHTTSDRLAFCNLSLPARVQLLHGVFPLLILQRVTVICAV